MSYPTDGQSVSFKSIKPYNATPMVMPGQKIKLGKDSLMRNQKRIKTREMVYRMKGKKFHPTFIVSNVNQSIPGQFSFNMAPYNF